jgi:hypothetical protein
MLTHPHSAVHSRRDKFYTQNDIKIKREEVINKTNTMTVPAATESEHATECWMRRGCAVRRENPRSFAAASQKRMRSRRATTEKMHDEETQVTRESTRSY